MKKIFLIFCVLATTFIAKAQKEFIVDPNAELRKLAGSFTSIRVSGGIDLYLSQSGEEGVAVSAAETKFRDGIKTVVENGTLRIWYDGEKGLSLKNRKMKAYISFKQLERLEASGASDLNVMGAINGGSLALILSGASDFKGAVKLDKLSIELSGASDVSIEGTAATVSIESSGASDVDGYDLSTDICTAKASGASDINITVNKELNAHASGSSNIQFKGKGLIKDMNASGSSNITRKGRR